MSKLPEVTLRAVLNRLIPADDFPSGWDAGCGSYIAQHLDGALKPLAQQLHDGLHALETEAQIRYGQPFDVCLATQQDEILRSVEKGKVRAQWGVCAKTFMRNIVQIAAEGYYADSVNGGNIGNISWKMLGFVEHQPNWLRKGRTPVLHEVELHPSIEAEYDAIVIGSGAAGGVVAYQIAEQGYRVLLIERGKWLHYHEVGADHLRNHRYARYGHNLGPELEGNPRVSVRVSGERVVLAPHQDGYHNNAMGVGGGTRVFGAQAWRFLPDDFKMATRYGVPEGSSLADWPLEYADLEPYYEQAEYEIGGSGDANAFGSIWPRQRAYPLPPFPDNPKRMFLKSGAQKLGWSCGPVPLAINTVAYNERPACVRCGLCVGFACPSESKNGTHNTVIPRALNTGRCTLLTEAQVERIETDGLGKVNGATYVKLDREGRLTRKFVRAKVVVVSARAIESARLLLLSRSSHHPVGLGNRFDQVGRHLQGHYYTGAFGQMEEVVENGLGPGVSIATCQWNHGNPGIIGGAMLANEFTKLPIIFYERALPPGLPRWGSENKNFMREEYGRQIHVQGPIQEIPNPESRVRIDDEIKDRFGIPVARFSGTAHHETVRTSEFIRFKAEEWLKASGAKKVWSQPNGLYLSAGQHQAGTCRMGLEPRTSVTDNWGAVHGHDNQFVVDGSLHVTNGGFNPVLTIMALAYRCSKQIIARLK